MIAACCQTMVQVANETADLVEDEITSRGIRDEGAKLNGIAFALLKAAEAGLAHDGQTEYAEKTIAVARDLLKTISGLVLLEDQGNIQVLVSLCKRAGIESKRVNPDLNHPGQLEEILPSVAAYHKFVLQRLQERTGNMKMPGIKAELERCERDLRQANNNHWAAAGNLVKMAQINPEAMQSLKVHLRRVDTILDEIILTCKEYFTRQANIIGFAFRQVSVF
jgi:hypothetical protein